MSDTPNVGTKGHVDYGITEEAGGQLKIPLVLRDQVILNLELTEKLKTTREELMAKDKEIALLREAVEAADKAFRFGIPDTYNGDDDDVGECAFCHGWNQHHKNHCEANKLVEALNKLKEHNK